MQKKTTQNSKTKDIMLKSKKKAKIRITFIKENIPHFGLLSVQFLKHLLYDPTYLPLLFPDIANRNLSDVFSN